VAGRYRRRSRSGRRQLRFARMHVGRQCTEEPRTTSSKGKADGGDDAGGRRRRHRFKTRKFASSAPIALSGANRRRQGVLTPGHLPAQFDVGWKRLATSPPEPPNYPTAARCEVKIDPKPPRYAGTLLAAVDDVGQDHEIICSAKDRSTGGWPKASAGADGSDRIRQRRPAHPGSFQDYAMRAARTSPICNPSSPTVAGHNQPARASKAPAKPAPPARRRR